MGTIGRNIVASDLSLLRRGLNETWREFFARWDTALRKISEHKVVLPEEYQGFLLINGLQLTENEARAMLNFTHGCIRPTSVKEWLRKNETKLSAAELGADRKKANGVLLTEALDELEDPQEYEVDEEINELEAYLMDYQKSQENDPEEILEENEAAEILATVLQQKRSYKQALKLRKEKELSRGYGKGYNGSFSGGKGRGKPSSSNRYNVSIEEVRKRTGLDAGTATRVDIELQNVLNRPSVTTRKGTR